MSWAAFWNGFWSRFLSPQTARFILALLALLLSAGGAFALMSGTIEAVAEDAVIFALGQLFALSTAAFGYYFGSTARGDERPIEAQIVNPPRDPIPVDPNPQPDDPDGF